MKVIKQTGTANTTYSPGRRIDYLAIHYTAGVSCKTGAARSCATWFANPNAGGSADYIVDEGELVQYNPDPHNRYCWAVGGAKYNTQGGRLYGIAKNANCISLEICSGNQKGKITYPNDPAYYFSTAVLAKAQEATQFLMDQYGIDADHVIRHYDVNGKCCLPIDRTELLTPNGWVSLGSVRIGMKVAQYDTEKDSITFAPVLDVVEPREELVLKNRYLEATADHRMWLKPNSKNSPNFREVLWGDALNGKKQYVIKTAGYLETDGIDLTDNELRLLVWIQADGHYMIEKRKEKGQGIYGIEFHVSKERKISRILELFDSMDIPYNLNSCKNGSVHIRTYEKSLYHWAETWLTNKVFNYNLIWMNQHQFEVFWEELVQADGSIEGQLYTSSIDHNNDVVQAICALHGKRSSKISMGKGGENTVLTAITNHTVGIGNSTLPIKKRNTMVSCVTVPSGFILVRNNSRTFIVGNCPGVIGWNKDSGSDQAWEVFHESIGGSPISWYRVRFSWEKPETQIGAYLDLEKAKICADAHPGFSVYNDEGKVVYTSKAAEKEYSPERWISLLAPDAMVVAHKNGILASVMLAQASLETGWGKTDLAQRHNIFGMKADLINSTWKEWSTWGGKVYKKYSPEEYGGVVRPMKSAFRVYDSYRQCMEDYAAFLLHVRNNKGLKYARIKGMKDPAAVIHAIRIGTGTDAHPEGYATDSGYENKIMNLIRKYDLTKYDADTPSEDIPVDPPAKKKMYRVQVEADRLIGAAQHTMEEIHERTGFQCFMEKGTDGWFRVFCGSFENKDLAQDRIARIASAFKTKYHGSFICEVEV